mmetsp:Transcript_97859/g.154795  ORF Transcript_97859/g.154795 Transcript_97859/m.154795 type:complete len:282 (-) Transcript_97859:187-1032(-)
MYWARSNVPRASAVKDGSFLTKIWSCTTMYCCPGNCGIGVLTGVTAGAAFATATLLSLAPALPLATLGPLALPFVVLFAAGLGFACELTDVPETASFFRLPSLISLSPLPSSSLTCHLPSREPTRVPVSPMSSGVFFKSTNSTLSPGAKSFLAGGTAEEECPLVATDVDDTAPPDSLALRSASRRSDSSRRLLASKRSASAASRFALSSDDTFPAARRRSSAWLLLAPKPPPKNASRNSSSAVKAPDLPDVSYLARALGSESVSYALLTLVKVSSSPPRSG